MSILFINRFFSDGCAEAEAELINWWFEEHAPAMQNILEVKKGFLYRIVGVRNAPTFQIIMVVENCDTILTPEWQQNIYASEWLTQLSLHFSWSAGVYEPIFPEKSIEESDFLDAQYVYITRMTPIPQMEEAFNDIYNNEHLSDICNVPGVRNGRRYRRMDFAFPNSPKYVALYELDDPLVEDKPEWAVARKHSLQRGVLRSARYIKSFPGAYSKVLKTEQLLRDSGA